MKHTIEVEVEFNSARNSPYPPHKVRFVHDHCDLRDGDVSWLWVSDEWLKAVGIEKPWTPKFKVGTLVKFSTSHVGVVKEVPTSAQGPYRMEGGSFVEGEVFTHSWCAREENLVAV